MLGCGFSSDIPLSKAIRDDAFRVTQSGTDTSARLNWSYFLGDVFCKFRRLHLKCLVFSTFVWPVLLAVVLYLHINQEMGSQKKEREKMENTLSSQTESKVNDKKLEAEFTLHLF